MLNNLRSIKNIKSKKRLGRGISSGKGRTSGRGTKGQKSRSGHNIPRRFEGGQTSLIARLPKAKGFKARNSKPTIVHILDIEKIFNDGDKINFKSLLEKKLISKKDIKNGVKVLGPGKLTKKLRFSDVKLTKKLVEDLKKLKMPPSKPSKSSKTSSSPKTSIKSSAKK